MGTGKLKSIPVNQGDREVKPETEKTCVILPESDDSAKKYFVSLQVQSVMRRRTFRTSPKVLLKASITTVLMVTIGFIVLYTILLRYFTPVPYHSSHKNRIKFIPKNGGLDVAATQHNYYSVKWNISEILGKTPTNICKSGIEFLILIVSAPENIKNRQAIRETWCNPISYKHPQNAWQCLFLIGQSHSRDFQKSLDDEFNSFRDIISGSYIDTYRNLTLKVMQGFHWSSRFCPANFILKTDDDCFVNTHNLHNLIIHHQDVHSLYIGHVKTDRNQRKVIRSKDNRWHVLPEEYSEEFYPPYISGVGYLLSRDVVRKIVNISQYIKIIPNEDAYVGILVQEVNISPTISARFQLSSSGWSLCNYIYLLVFHRIEPIQQKEVFTKTLQALQQCKNKMKLTWN